MSSFGFGGSNFHCVLEEHGDGCGAEVFWDGDVELIAASAPDRETLLARVAELLPDGIAWRRLAARAAKGRAAFEPSAPFRALAVVERDRLDPARRRASVEGLLSASPEGSERTPASPEGSERTPASAVLRASPDGVFVGLGAAPGELAVLFPGQGSQAVGMLRDLACRFPAMREALAGLDAVFVDQATRPSDLIFPPARFDEAARAEDEARLRATENAQPAIGAVSLGALRVLEGFGVSPGAFAGHSYGELTALCAAGRLLPAHLFALSRVRGALMAEAGAAGGDAGAMLAVSAPLAEVEELIADEALDLVLANRNAPEQAVLSGASREIDRAAGILGERGVRCRRLPVSAAFHSGLVAAARGPFRDALSAVAIEEGRAAVWANRTAGAYPEDADAARDLLADQLVSPVAFVDQIEAMHADGVRTFLEVGPGARLTGLVGRILDGREHVAVAVDASAGKRPGVVDLARALAAVAAAGHAVALDRWNEGVEVEDEDASGGKPRMTVRLSGANHFVPPEPRAPRAPKAQSQMQSQSQPKVEQSPQVAPAGGIMVGGNGNGSNGNGGSPAPAHHAPADALGVIQQNMVALQRLQEQTAKLHQQFLEGQAAAQETFGKLFAQQHAMLLGAPAPLAPSPVAPSPAAIGHGHGHGSRATDHGPRSTQHEQPAPVSPSLAPSPAPAAASASVSPAPSPEAEGALLEVVAEKTGYPVEMLELGMELDADLGIDSIKRVEIMSALKEKLPGAPEVKSEHLGALRTLADVVGFLGNGTSAAAPAPTPTAAPAGATEEALLGVVAEKTGYPVDMLELGMELDADLGIDSIKRVEIMSALKEKLPGAPEVKSEHLGTLRTLADVVAFLGDGTAAPAAPAPAPLAASADAESALLAVVAEKTGYPVDMLELEMELDADLGIDSIKRVEIMSALREKLPGAPEVKSEHLGTLRTLADVVTFLAGSATATTATATAMETETATATVPATVPATATRTALTRSIVRPVPLTDPASRPLLALSEYSEFWVIGEPALTAAIAAGLAARGLSPREMTLDETAVQPAPLALGGLILIAPADGGDDGFIRDAFSLLQRTGPALRRSGAGDDASLLFVSRYDGAFGRRAFPADVSAAAGGLAGLVKTAGHEWPEVSAKALDFDRALDPTRAAAAIVEEALRRGPTEVGVTTGGLVTFALEPAPLGAVDRSAVALGADDVVVVTGGARGVTAATAAAIGSAWKPTLLLLGRSPLPEAEPSFLAGLTDEAEIKKAIARSFGAGATPRKIQQRWQRVAADREIRANLARIAATGARILYRSVDVRDPASVAAALSEARGSIGPIRGIVHGAGVLADRLIEEKTAQQLAQVYDTKVAGLRALLDATAGDELRFIALFSSISGREGRRGQADYACANEVLNRWADRLAGERPGCRVVSIGWGPWRGGMVGPELERVFAAEGVGLIDQAAGGEHLVDEIAATDGAVETIVLAGDPTDPPAEKAPATTAVAAAPAPAPSLPRAFERTLDIAGHPFLRAHVLDGRAVLPMAMMVEWLAHGAIHGNPGLAFCGVDELRVLKGVTLHDDSPRAIAVHAGRAAPGGDAPDQLLVPVELRSDETLHARGSVVLAPRLPEAGAPGPRPVVAALEAGFDPYGELLFHGKELQGIQTIEGCSDTGIVAIARAAPAPAQWVSRPARSRWLADPLALDTAFQLMIVWSDRVRGAASLPTFAGRYRQLRRAFPAEGTRIVCRVIEGAEHRARATIEWLDLAGGLVARLEHYECVIDASLRAAFAKNRLGQGVAS